MVSVDGKKYSREKYVQVYILELYYNAHIHSTQIDGGSYINCFLGKEFGVKQCTSFIRLLPSIHVYYIMYNIHSIHIQACGMTYHETTHMRGKTSKYTLLALARNSYSNCIFFSS